MTRVSKGDFARDPEYPAYVATVDAAGNQTQTLTDTQLRATPVPVSVTAAPPRTYFSAAYGVTPPATATDLFGLVGSASKTVTIVNAGLRLHSTAAAAQLVTFVKRSAANTGGTPGAVSAGSADSADPAASASVVQYAAVPSALGAASMTVLSTVLTTTTLINNGTSLMMAGAGFAGPSGSLDASKNITLRGTSEGFYLGHGGGAIAAGASYDYFVEWTES